MKHQTFTKTNAVFEFISSKQRYFYPSATSKTIIKTNPNTNPIVARFLFSFTDSGKSSLATTAIIAPAENESKIGIILLTARTKRTPITADKGSTKADACPIKKLLFLEKPSLLRGSDTAAPSGKFCIPIPIASINAPTTVIPGTPAAIPPNKCNTY